MYKALRYLIKGGIFVFVFLLSSCNNKQGCFNGSVNAIHDVDSIISLTSESIKLDSVNSEYFIVADSLIIFCNQHRNAKCFYDVYNLYSNKNLGGFFSRGRGHGEYISLPPITNFIHEDNCLKALVYAPNESKMLKWNITKSIQSDSLVYDDMVVCRWYGQQVVPYSKPVLLDDERFLVFLPGVYIPTKNIISLPEYQIRTYSDDKLVKDFRVFNDVKNNRTSKILPESFYLASISYNIEKSLIVEAMNWLPQINIINFDNNQIKGFLLDEHGNYDIFESDMSDAKYYYHRVVSTNNYIYALWCGKTVEETLRGGISFDTIHVFNWNGEFKYKLKLDHLVSSISIDASHKYLYALNTDSQFIYRYKLNER